MYIHYIYIYIYTLYCGMGISAEIVDLLKWLGFHGAQLFTTGQICLDVVPQCMFAFFGDL